MIDSLGGITSQLEDIQCLIRASNLEPVASTASKFPIFSSAQEISSIAHDVARQQLSWAKYEGGSTLYDATKRIMLKLSNDNVWIEFNRSGAAGKRRFPLSLERMLKGKII